MRNICKSKDEFYRLMFNALKNNGADNYCNSDAIYELLEPYKTFDELPADLRYGFMECQSSNSDSALEELVNIIRERIVTWEGKTHYEQVGLNIYSEYWDESYITSFHEGLSGFHQLPTGEVFYAYEGHLDCHETFNIIIYAEDGKLKLYAPEKGNVYDARYMCAFCAEDDVYDRCGDSEEHSYDNEDTLDMKCNPELELADIADYFQNRKEGEHAKGLKDFNPQFQPQTLEWNLENNH